MGWQVGGYLGARIRVAEKDAKKFARHVKGIVNNPRKTVTLESFWLSTRDASVEIGKFLLWFYGLFTGAHVKHQGHPNGDANRRPEHDEDDDSYRDRLEEYESKKSYPVEEETPQNESRSYEDKGFSTHEQIYKYFNSQYENDPNYSPLGLSWAEDDARNDDDALGDGYTSTKYQHAPEKYYEESTLSETMPMAPGQYPSNDIHDLESFGQHIRSVEIEEYLIEEALDYLSDAILAKGAPHTNADLESSIKERSDIETLEIQSSYHDLKYGSDVRIKYTTRGGDIRLYSRRVDPSGNETVMHYREPYSTLDYAQRPFKVSDEMISIMKSYEKGRDVDTDKIVDVALKAYMDRKKGKATIGYGSTYHKDGTPVKMGDTLESEAAAMDLFLYHLEKRSMSYINKRVNVPVTQEAIDMYGSLVFNRGFLQYPRNHAQFPGKEYKVLKHLDRGMYWESAQEILDINKDDTRVLSGLTKRRLAEFNHGTSSLPPSTGPYKNKASSRVISTPLTSPPINTRSSPREWQPNKSSKRQFSNQNIWWQWFGEQ